jgi:hypothetical protein
MILNSSIIESPVILFLGAGASVPLGKPVTKDFVARLVEQVTAEDEAALLRILISARGYDLEAIMTDLETLLNLRYVSNFIFKGAEEFGHEEAENLCSLIRHSIIREYRSVDTQKAIEIYRPLFDTIFSHIDFAAHCLPVFTTNYDLAIERFCKEQYSEYELVDGLEDDPLEREVFWNPSQFERFTFRDASLRITLNGVRQEDRRVRHIILFKLHGSVNWLRVMSNGKIVQSLPMYDVVDSDSYQNTIIYPAGNKVATAEPYLTGYHYFSRCCERAKVVIAIGYSFRDYDALAGLLKAWQINPRLKVLLLAPVPDAYDILQSIPAEVGSTWPVYGYFGDADSEPKYLEEINKWLSYQLKKER